MILCPDWSLFFHAINDPAASSRVSKTTSEASFEGEAPAAYAAGGATRAPLIGDGAKRKKVFPAASCRESTS